MHENPERMIPDFSPLVERIDRAVVASLLADSREERRLAGLLREASVAIKALTLLAEFYERKAGQARTEPVKLIVETIEDLGDGRAQGEAPWAK